MGMKPPLNMLVIFQTEKRMVMVLKDIIGVTVLKAPMNVVLQTESYKLVQCSIQTELQKKVFGNWYP